MQGSRRGPLELRRPALVFWTIALATLALDQVTKSVVRASLAVGELRSFVPGVVDLTHVRNVGAAFGLLPGQQPVFIAVSVVVLVVLAGYWRRARPRLSVIVVALSLIAAGAVGNLIDRVLTGRVTDFLSFAFIDFPVFNVADSAIVCGTAVLIAWLLFAPAPPGPDGEDQE